MNAMLNVGIAACVVLLIGANVLPWLVGRWKSAPAKADSDMLPCDAAKAYIAEMLAVPGATAEQQVAALKANQSPADFMRSLLSKGAA